MKVKCVQTASFLLALLSLSIGSNQLSAQRIYDEFDAPSINQNALYKDIGVEPSTLISRYNGPIQLSDMPYQELTATFPDRTVFTPPANLDDDYFQIVTPFNMQFDNNSYPAGSNIWVSTNGFVIIGGIAAPVQPYSNSAALFTNTDPLNVIAPYWGNHRYVTDTTEVSWQIIGVAPKRQLVIQWTNLDINHDGSSRHNFASFQVILWERSMFRDRTHNASDINSQPDVDFVYGDAVVSNLSYLNGASVGLKGSNGQFVNGLLWNNIPQAASSKALTQVWPPSGNTNARIRLETYQRSLGVPYTYFESRLIPPQPPLGLRTDPDDGYYRVDLNSLNFNYTFGGVKQQNIWINVNGFATFQNPDIFSSIANNVSSALFTNSASYPNFVVAPFWGDHYYRKAGDATNNNIAYLPSEVSYMITGAYPNRRLVVQWKNLNILAKDVPSSVGNFQAVLYEGVDDKFPGNYAGGIEFAYGDVGNPNLPSAPVVTNAAVGLKGNTFGVNASLSDFINGLMYDSPQFAFSSQLLTTIWRPSGGGNSGEGRRIFFRAIPRWFLPGWGDGDATLSQLRTRKHAGMIQNRFVTVDDSRLVLRWQVKTANLPDSVRKDSLRLGNAYHADVNHDGRYYYSTRTWDNLRDTSIWKRTIDRDTTGKRIRYDSLESLSGLPPDAGPLRLIYFDANALDAALILHYISGRVFSLPWIFDTIPGEVGKVNGRNTKANNIVFGTPNSNGLNIYTIPVYVNGTQNGPVSLELSASGKIINVTPVNSSSDNIVLAESNGDKLALAADGYFVSNEPIAYVTIECTEPVLSVSNIEFNGLKKENQQVMLDNSNDGNAVVQPNPAANTASITYTIPADGHYNLVIVDVVGRPVATLYSGALTQGTHTFVWNVNESAAETGMYIARLTGNAMNTNAIINVVR